MTWGENEITIGETSTGGLTVEKAPEVVWVQEALLRAPDLDAGRLEVREGEFVMHADNGDWTYRHIGDGPEPGVLAFQFVREERTVDGVTFEVVRLDDGSEEAA